MPKLIKWAKEKENLRKEVDFKTYKMYSCCVDEDAHEISSA